VLQVAGWALTGVAFAAAGRATVVRLRGSDPALRQQMKWVAYAAAVLGVLWVQWTAAYVGPMNYDAVAGIEVIVVTAALAGEPVAMGIAILRRGLFDIDLIIRRTLVYALLVAALTGVYLTGVVGLSAALRAVAGGTGTSSSRCRRWPWRQRSSRCAPASSGPSTSASTGRGTTPRRPSTASPTACATRSTWAR
jgi:hypothetical protein